MYKSWLKWCKSAAEPVRENIKIIQDFPPAKDEVSDSEGSPRAKKRKLNHGIQGLAVAYENEKAHVEKGRNIVDFEREGSCAICQHQLEHGDGIYTICPAPECESVTHLTCLSQHFLKDDDDSLVPIKGRCPSCGTELRWVDVVKELTLRMRGQKEVDKLLKVKRARKGKGTASQAAIESSDEGSEMDEEAQRQEFEDQLQELIDSDQERRKAVDEWHEIDDSDDSDTRSINSRTSVPSKPAGTQAKKAARLDAIIEDSDWDDAEILD